MNKLNSLKCFDNKTVYSYWTELFEIELIICIKMDLVLNGQQRLICHKTQTTNIKCFGGNWCQSLFVCFFPYSQRNKLETYLSTYICIFILMLPFCLKVTNENFTVYTSEMKNFKTNFSSGLLSTKGFWLHVT